jgi:cardiolipin hydrolase
MPPDVAERLSQSFAQRPLSRAERQELAEFFEGLDRDDLRGEARGIAFRMVRDALSQPTDPAGLLDWLEDVIKALFRPARPAAAEVVSEACFSPGQDCARRIVQLLSGARKAIDACVFTITDDRISDALVEARKRGIATRIITDDEKAHDLGSDIERFRSAGIPVRVDRSEYHMHHKFALIDGARLLTGSYNWTRGASRDNEENFIITTDRRLVEAFGRTFEALWKRLG